MKNLITILAIVFLTIFVGCSTKEEKMANKLIGNTYTYVNNDLLRSISGYTFEDTGLCIYNNLSMTTGDKYYIIIDNIKYKLYTKYYNYSTETSELGSYVIIVKQDENTVKDRFLILDINNKYVVFDTPDNIWYKDNNWLK